MLAEKNSHIILLLIALLMGLNGSTQSWEHLTPIKSSDRLKASFVLNDSTAYMGGFFGRLVKTIDAGKSWSQIDDVTGYPINGGIWGMSFPTDSIGFIPDDAGRIYKTEDAGASWEQIYLAAGSNFYDAYFFNKDSGFVCGEFGELLKTTDGGDSWESVETAVTTRLYDFCFANDSLGFIALRSGDILKSDDSGDTWTSVGLTNMNDLYHIDFVDDSLGIAVGLNGIILRSEDAGITWEEIDSGVNDRLSCIEFINDSIALITGDYGLILRSDDGGESFSEISTSSVYNLWNVLSFPNGLSYVLGDRIVFESTDLGSTWSFRFDGVPTAQLMRMVFTDSNTVHAAGRAAFGGNGRSAIIKSEDGGRVWHTNYESSSQFGDVTDLSFVDTENGFASAYNTIRVTTNGGIGNWNSLNEDGYFTAIHFIDSDTGLVGNTLDGIFRSTDGGLNWNLVDACADVNHFFFLDSDTGYAATDGGSIRKTIDGGVNWTPLDAGVFSNLQSVFFVNDSTGYAVGDNGAGVRTSDYGTSWNPIPLNQFARDVYCPDPMNPDSVYVLMASGEVQKSIDGGANWTIAFPNMNNQIMWDFEFIGPYIYSCGDHGDILRSRIVPCPEITLYIDTVVCESFIAPNGEEYFESGEYIVQTQGQEGCLINNEISLLVHQNSSSSISQTSCNSYSAPDGSVYTESGMYTALISNANGCDSLIAIDLTIQSINTTILESSPTLTAQAEGLLYQWLDCTNEFVELEGETNISFTAVENGAYALQLDDGICVDTSSCITVTNTFLPEIALPAVSVYPNPFQDKIIIEIPDFDKSVQIYIYTLSGERICKEKFRNPSKVEFNIKTASGLYLLEIRDDEKVIYRKKILKY